MHHGAGKAVLTVAKADYTTVLVPPLRTIRSSTMALVKKFHRAGGAVVFSRQVPAYVDGLPSREAIDLAKRCPRVGSKSALVKAVEPTARRVSITDGQGRQITPTLYCLREDAEAFYLFVCNTSHNLFGKERKDIAVRQRRLAFQEVHMAVSGHAGGLPFELDAETGQIFTADGKASAKGWTMRTSLPVLGSRLFVLPKKRSGKTWP